MIALYIIIGILIFGVLIASHELGHFTAAKALGVRVNEFSVGMGPALLKRQRGETLYALRAFPIGGYCAMEGEDELSEDSRAFSSAAAWKRLIILVAGSAANFLVGFLIVLILFSVTAKGFYTTTVRGFADGSTLSESTGLQSGDRLVKINGERIWLRGDIDTVLSRSGSDSADVTVERGGSTVELRGVSLTYQNSAELRFTVRRATVGAQLENAWYHSVDFVRLVRMGLVDLVTGNAGVKDLSGPIGIVDTITEIGTDQSYSRGEALGNVLYLAAFIAVNLSVMNMLPIPALDGGRVFFLLLTWVIEKIIRRKLDPKYEGYIHAVGLVLLIGFMLVVMYNDIVRLFF